MRKIVQGITRGIVDIMFPVECLGCKQEGQWLCAICQRQIQVVDSDKCFGCHQPQPFGAYCTACREKTALSGIFVATSYGDTLVRLVIKTFKYRLVRELRDTFSQLLITTLRSQLTRATMVTDRTAVPDILRHFDNTTVIPVPLHPRRERWRGFNQSAVLATPVAEHFNLAVDTQYLVRTRYTSTQTKLNHEQRARNVADCFSWRGQPLSGKHVLLVDDVATSGATLHVCAQVVRNAGAGEVWGLVVAKG